MSKYNLGDILYDHDWVNDKTYKFRIIAKFKEEGVQLYCIADLNDIPEFERASVYREDQVPEFYMTAHEYYMDVIAEPVFEEFREEDYD